MKFELAAAISDAAQEGWNIGSFHKSITRRHPPVIWRNLRKGHALGILDPWHGFSHCRQNEKIMMQAAIVLDAPDHQRRRVMQGSRQKNRRAGHARNLARLDRGHEFVDWNEPFVQSLRDRLRAAMPHQHDAINETRQEQRDVAAIEDLGDIRGKEGGVDAKKGSGDQTR